MSLVDALISAIVPYECLGCGAEGRLLCLACAAELQPAFPCCYRCRAPSQGCLTCADCQTVSALQRVMAAVTYEQLAKNLIWKLKFGHAQRAAKEVAALMGGAMDRQDDPADSFLIVPVPTATTRIRQRGYDQARLLARELARLTRQPYVDALARQNQAHQVGASRHQRLEQLTGAFRVTKHRAVRDARILLIDDVVTTGATLESAALALRAAGARQIEALVFAQPKFRRQDTVSRSAALPAQP